MFGTTFNSLYLHEYVIGRYSSTHMLKRFPAETGATLAAASALYSAFHG